MITAKEKTRERFPKRSNRDNPDKQNHRNNRHQERKHGPDNTVAVTDKSRKFSKPRRYDDIENMRCILHPNGKHTIGNCYTFNKQYTRKDSKGNHEDKGFQKIQGDGSSDLYRGPRFQKQASRKVSSTNHHGNGAGYSKISQLVTVSNPVFKRRPMD